MYLAVGLDDWIGASCNVSFEIFFVSSGIIVAVLAFTHGGRKRSPFAPSLHVLFLLALPFIELGPVKPAIRAVRDIHPGMSESEVHESESDPQFQLRINATREFSFRSARETIGSRTVVA